MGKNIWTAEQLSAIEERDSNILVSASAGSGKTAVLVERIIERVTKEFLDIDKILVVTFTNAAAQELKEKILNAIYTSINTQKDKKILNHLKNQLVYINRANIMTIDAFCLKLVKENFDILSVEPNIRICEESQSMLLKTEVLEDLLQEEYESYVDERKVFGLYNVLELFGGKEEGMLENIVRIYNFIQAFPYPFDWLNDQIKKYNINEDMDLYNTDFGKDIYDDIIAEIKLCIVKYDEWFAKIQNNSEFNKCFEILNQDIYELKSCINISNPCWDVLYENIFNIEFPKFYIGKVTNVDLKDDIANFRRLEVKSVIENCKKKIYAKSKEIIADNQIAYEYINYLYDFLVRFDEAFKLKKKSEGVAEFNDIMHYALELLVNRDGSITDLAYNLSKKYDEIYTDEYQDTSFVQESILEAISKPNNRFMVGDIKQSIYGFRQARPDIFNLKYETYLKEENKSLDNEYNTGRKIILSKNFRSRQETITAINYIFEKLMSMKIGQCAYGTEESLKCGNTSYITDEKLQYNTQINIIDVKKDKDVLKLDNNEEEFELDEDLNLVEIEAKCLALKIKQIIDEVKVTDKAGNLRKASYKDIVILLRGIKNKAQKYEQALKDNNIPVFCDTSSSIFEGDEIKLILSLLKILDNPYQDIYMISIMYSIIGNFTLDEITKIRLYNSKSYIYDTLIEILEDNDFKQNESDIYEKVQLFIESIQLYIKYSKLYSIPQLLIKLYKDTNIYNQFALEENSSSKKANLDYLVELASKTNISNTLNSYIKYIDSLKDKVDTSSATAKIIGENEDVVRIMTIHKSKGLEFPIVILADCSKTYNFKDVRQQKVNFHYEYGIGIDVVNQGLGVTYPSIIKQSIKSVLEKEIKSEEIRLLYVALTRAKEKLYIFATTKDYEKDYQNQNISIQADNKFNESLILSNTSYYKNLLPVIKYYNMYDNNTNIFDINVVHVASNANDDELKAALKVIDEKKHNHSINEIASKLDINLRDNNTIDELKQRYEKVYKYSEDLSSPARISVSNLKKNMQDEISNLTQVISDETDTKVARDSNEFMPPSSINEDSNSYTAVRKGILIHFILQKLNLKTNYTKQDLQNYISDLVLNGTINKKDEKYISVSKIYNFLNSTIGKKVYNAKKIYKEYEFILDNKNISNSLIQGVIDLFYVTDNDKVVLVDFKTDKLTNESEFVSRYKIQLDIYKEAINTLTDYNVDKVYIYSFNLNKEIKI